ncbi:hypothetical protein NP233_g7261 [Leucocoprinus birnbaumii]|uniref:DUF6533 domain-containing protein n=1 Tax=Leucocoprinus birnbaumii TaxID=56174 RepID=A0AAD5VRS1_9AGAR|nr:hypothetical protein NP233_g7261 [Leucocoprinus birnbaumii]
MSEDIDAVLRELEHGIVIWRNVNYVFGTALVHSEAYTAVMVLEWLQTLNLEISLVWYSPWSLLKVLYLLSRYTPLIYWPAFYYSLWSQKDQFGSQGIGLGTCENLVRYIVCTYTIGASFTELLLTIRTWAVCECSRKMAFALFPAYVAAYAGVFTLVCLWLVKEAECEKQYFSIPPTT